MVGAPTKESAADHGNILYAKNNGPLIPHIFTKNQLCDSYIYTN